MVAIARVSAFVLRIVFFGASIYGLLLILRGEEKAVRARQCCFAAIAALFMSECLTSLNINHAIFMAIIYVALLGGSFANKKLLRSNDDLYIPVSLLVSLGVAVGAVVMLDRFMFQCIFVLFGIVACCLVVWLAREYANTLAFLYRHFLIATAVLCALPLIPFISKPVNDALSWIQIGPISIQPSEFAKVTLAIGLAGYCAANAARLRSRHWRGIYPLLCAFVGALGIELKTGDMGTAMVMFGVVAAVVMATSGKQSVLYAGITLIAVTAILVAGYFCYPRVQGRIDIWLSASPPGNGTHLDAVNKSISNGGVVGTGLGLGHEMWYLPERDGDSIYAAIVEELGLMGGFITLLAIAALLILIARMIKNLPEASFESNVLVASLTFFGFQAFVIVGGLLRIIPLTGVTLPFVARGGSSMVSCFMLMGLCGLGKTNQKEEEKNYKFSTAYLPFALVAGLAICFCFTVIRAEGIKICGYTEHCHTGTITTADGVVLAKTVTEEGKTRRSFPEKTSCVHVLGKYDAFGNKALSNAGIEYIIDGYDFKKENCNSLCNVFGIPETLGDTTLTIDSSIQKVAEQQLSGTTAGAIVAVNNEDGSILAEASWPSYDIEELSKLELKNKLEQEGRAKVEGEPTEQVLSGIRDRLDKDKSGCLMNRVRKQLYAPGSTFKIVTSVAALQSGDANENTLLPGDTITLSDNTTVPNYKNANHGQITLSRALEVSSNTAFASLALRIGNPQLQAQAEAFGLNAPVERQVLEVETSTYGAATTDYSLAWAAVGQPSSIEGVTQGPYVTVLQMARIMAAMANGGKLVTPHLIKEGLLSQREASLVDSLHDMDLSVETVNAMRDMLQGSSHVVCKNHEVMGKTGTAETQTGNRCWYVCSSKGVTVATCIEGDSGQLGFDVALPRGLAVLDAAVGLGGYSVIE